MSEYKQIRYWVDALPRRGKVTFALSEVKEEFPDKPREQIKNALSRLASSGKIVSVWRGFYAIILPEHGEKRIVPPIEYIGHLMKYLGNDYYIASLSAAALHGASHHKPQVFTFVCNKIMHQKSKDTVRLVPLFKKHISHGYVEKRNVSSGIVNISSPLLTAVDLLQYHEKSGGLDNTVTVLSELAESIKPGELGGDIYASTPASVIQRLGYLYDAVLGENTLADALLENARAASVKFRKAPLACNKKMSHTDYYDTKWKIVVNEEPEPDI